MHLPKPAPATSPTPLRQVNIHLAAAYQAAQNAHDSSLLNRLDRLWRDAEKAAQREEMILSGEMMGALLSERS